MAEILTNDISAYSSSLDNVNVDNSILGKDDFMKLLLVELQHQDPTSPMDSDKILSQTSQLAALETQEKTNTALENLSASFVNSKNFSAVSAIGKMAQLENNVSLRINEDGNPTPVNFNLEFNEPATGGTIHIYDEDNRLMKSMDIPEGYEGTKSFNWDGKTNAGENAAGGDYTIDATYQNTDGLTLAASAGSYKIESVKFEDSKTYVKLNGNYISFDQVAEIYEA